MLCCNISLNGGNMKSSAFFNSFIYAYQKSYFLFCLYKMTQPTKHIKIYLRQLSVSPKKKHYSQNILQFKYDIKKKWNVMKEIIGKVKHSKKSNFPRKLKIGNKIKTGENGIANEFNKYFADIGPSLAKNIPKPSILFESFLKRVNTTLPIQSLSINELKDVFYENKQKSWC